MGLLLDISPRILEKVLYFASYIVTDPGDAPLSKCQILTEKDYRDMREKYEDDFDAGMGAEAIKKLRSRSTAPSSPSSCALSSRRPAARRRRRSSSVWRSSRPSTAAATARNG